MLEVFEVTLALIPKYIADLICRNGFFFVVLHKTATYCRMEIFDILKERRIFLKITQEELADITGVSPRTIGNIEQGKGNPSFSTMNRIAYALGMEITAIIRKTAQ